MSEWLDTGRHTRCPQCLSVDGLKVRQVLKAHTASLAGAQLKTAVTWGWVYKCFNCGAEGDTQPKAPEEHGKWTDGLGNEPYE